MNEIAFDSVFAFVVDSAWKGFLIHFMFHFLFWLTRAGNWTSFLEGK